MKKNLIALLSVYMSFCGIKAFADCENPETNDCWFYVDCLEEKFECGYTGYPVSYGFKFCRKFQKAEKFSKRGRAWINSTMLCLQQRLVPFMGLNYENNDSACKAIEDWGFSTHASCYTEHENSFCDLGPIDLAIAMSVIGPGPLIGNIKARSQVREVLGICLNRLRGKPSQKSKFNLLKDAYNHFDVK
jgi:hypothetical protein